MSKHVSEGGAAPAFALSGVMLRRFALLAAPRRVLRLESTCCNGSSWIGHHRENTLWESVRAQRVDTGATFVKKPRKTPRRRSDMRRLCSGFFLPLRPLEVDHQVHVS